jgi:hypothetical protein
MSATRIVSTGPSKPFFAYRWNRGIVAFFDDRHIASAGTSLGVDAMKFARLPQLSLGARSLTNRTSLPTSAAPSPRGGERYGKGVAVIMSCVDERDERKQTSADASKAD